MKLIHNFKSPNFNDRKSNNIEIIVIHYTALSSISNSLKHLCSKKNKVSSHYLISQEGKIYSLVSEKKRAWHAGVSQFEDREKCNDFSIGIELEGADQIPYTPAQYQMLSQVTQLLISHYPALTPQRIVGHSDISPGRKTDPGPAFDWALFKQSLS